MGEYKLKHKNQDVALLSFDEDSGALVRTLAVADESILPVSCQDGHIGNLSLWWKRRAASPHRRDIRALLERGGFRTVEAFLLKNLALSVSDAYWLCPKDLDLVWEELSFHLKPKPDLTPMASSGGELEKEWIREAGRLQLVKGNVTGYYFQQSLNEVLATSIHKAQGYTNYTPYSLTKLKDGSNGCICPCFTSEDVELIPAWELFAKYSGMESSGSLLEDYERYAALEGFDRKAVGASLDYMFTVDYLISNSDRHTNNFGLLRDSNTLSPIGPAPIFDSGNSMFHLGGGIASFHDLFHLTVSSLYASDGEIMDRVQNPALVDLSKLPSREEVVALLSSDPVVAPSAERLYSYLLFKANVVKARQCGLSMGAAEERIAAIIKDDSERVNINRGWDQFWAKLS